MQNKEFAQNLISQVWWNAWEMSFTENTILLRDNKLPQRQGFTILIEARSCSLTAIFSFESASLNLLEVVNKSIEENRALLQAILHKDQTVRLSLERLAVQENFQDKQHFSQDFKLIIRKTVEAYTEKSLLSFIDLLKTLVLIVFPYKQEVGAITEGRQVEVALSRYERSAKNRAIALSVHGYRCKACDLQMDEKYGAIAHNLIHVHHIIPVSEGERIFDPLVDLVPLCPNCHTIAHQQEPPLLPKQIRELIQKEHGIQIQ
ncbi:HNH endonuclease [Sediminitomix flava]|uniref:HNH endonuclease n=1 Tax=Sediminitomix flava TaxID=379075 RepID=A0A315ZZ73_SEDFL|nr:HNH endonuclease [Sediminitomix flava]PWJ42667.1 HNH endonuclease [Sediminitomix flava]